MRRFVMLLCVLAGVSLPAGAMERFWRYCEKGGFNVITQGLTSDSTFQRSFRSCTVEVFVAGTLVHPSNIYSDNNSPAPPTPLSNPFTSNTDGYFEFYAPAGRYDVKILASVPPERNLSPNPYSYTWGDILLCDPLGPNADANCGGGGGAGNVNWYVDNAFIGTEPGGDFVHGTNGITLTGTDDPGNTRVHITVNGPSLTTLGGCPLIGPCPINVYNNGVFVGKEPALNLIPGTGITLNPFTDAAGRINVTFNAGSLPLAKTYILLDWTDATDTGKLQFEEAGSIHLVRVYCSVFGATNAVINLDARPEGAPNTDTGNHLLGADLTCTTTGANTSTFANGAGQCGGTTSCAVAANTNVVLTETSVSGATLGDALRVTVQYTKD